MQYQTIFRNLEVKRGEETVVFNVAVDQVELRQMALKASRNKSKRSKDGAVLIEVVRISNPGGAAPPLLP